LCHNPCGRTLVPEEARMPIPKQPFTPDAEGPLRGVRVLDFSRLVAGNMLSL